MTVVLDGATLTPALLSAVAAGAAAELDPVARLRMLASAEAYEEHGRVDLISDKVAWLTGEAADRSSVAAFVLGHCAGVGPALPRGLVRAMLAARVNVLAAGYSGCRPVCADVLLAMLDADVVPVVPCQGSVGAAGVPQLAHIARVACGFGGQAWREGELLPTADAMRGIPLLDPSPKEALALLNGSSYTTALAATATARARTLLQTAEAACALSFEVVRADLGCLDARALEARRHPGGIAVARRLCERLAGSEIVGVGRKPDPFSVRCAPAVLGAAFDVLDHVEQVIVRELNAAVDNPLVFAGGVVEAGNFHAAPVAMAVDQLKIALTQVANISERRTFRMTYGQLSGLPSFLVPGTGLNSGLMLAQYTAASLVSECKGLCHPASVDSIPTVQHREDHVSMGPIAGRAALKICDALADVLAIELLCGAQGLDFHLTGHAIAADGSPQRVPPQRAGRGTTEVHGLVRGRVAHWDDDRVLHPDLVAVGSAVREGAFATTGIPW